MALTGLAHVVRDTVLISVQSEMDMCVFAEPVEDYSSDKYSIYTGLCKAVVRVVY